MFATAEDLTNAHIDQMIATNLTGSIHLARAVLPHLRTQGGGLLMQMSSMGGQLTFPGFSLYHVTKWGIEGFFDAATRVPVSAPYRGGPADQESIRVEEMPDSQENVVVRGAPAATPTVHSGPATVPAKWLPGKRNCLVRHVPGRRGGGRSPVPATSAARSR